MCSSSPDRTMTSSAIAAWHHAQLVPLWGPHCPNLYVAILYGSEFWFSFDIDLYSQYFKGDRRWIQALGMSNLIYYHLLVLTKPFFSIWSLRLGDGSDRSVYSRRDAVVRHRIWRSTGTHQARVLYHRCTHTWRINRHHCSTDLLLANQGMFIHVCPIDGVLIYQTIGS